VAGAPDHRHNYPRRGKAKKLIADLIRDPVTAPWVIHDLRRPCAPICRGRRSATSFAMIAHAQKGTHAVYDQYSYLEEKRRGFDLWAAKLCGILRPSTGENVIELHTRSIIPSVAGTSPVLW
jgi:hypothetical protein